MISRKFRVALFASILVFSFLSLSNGYISDENLDNEMTPLEFGISLGSMSAEIEWTFSSSSLFDSDPVAVDLDTDGTQEILVGCNNRILYCLNHTGSIEWSCTTDEWILGSPSVADLDKDGSLEIVIGTRGSTLYCFDSEGTIEWTFSSVGWAWSTACLADINLDGYLEILFTTNGNMLYCLNHTGGEIWHTDTGNVAEVPPAVGDFDEDGIPDIVVGNHNGRVYCYNSTGHEIWNAYAGGGIMNSAFCITDLDVDGHLELVIGSWDQRVYCFHHNGSQRWSFLTGGDIDMSSAAAVDLDNDGTLEVLIGSVDDRLYCLDHNGNEEWHYQTSGNVRGSPMVADLNNNGHLEIIIPSQDNYLYCLDYTGAINWSVDLGDSPWEDPCISDLNGDGVYEIVVSAFSELLCISLTGVTNSGSAPWPCYLGSTHHTGWIDGDSDYLDDFSESMYYQTFPNLADSDLDSWVDGVEVFAGTDPLDSDDFPSYPIHIAVTRTPLIPSQDDMVNVIVTANYHSGINQSTLSYNSNGGLFTNVSMSNATGHWIGVIPAFPAYTVVQYTVYVQSGLWEWNVSTLYSYEVVDTDAPVISTSRSSMSPTDVEAVTINATIIDASPIVQVLLRYSNDSQQTWNEIPMIDAGTHWYAVIPLQNGGANVSYYVAAEDYNHNWGNSATLSYVVNDVTPPRWITEPINQEIMDDESFIYQIQADDTSGIGGWNLNDTLNFRISSTGLITNATSLDIGRYYLNITVWDIFDNVAWQVIQISVIPSTTITTTTTTNTSNGTPDATIFWSLLLVGSTGVTVVALVIILVEVRKRWS